MLYTREEMINTLMLYERDYVNDFESKKLDELNGKTPLEFIEDSYRNYRGMSTEKLRQQHMTILDGLYDEDSEEVAIETRMRLLMNSDSILIHQEKNTLLSYIESIVKDIYENSKNHYPMDVEDIDILTKKISKHEEFSKELDKLIKKYFDDVQREQEMERSLKVSDLIEILKKHPQNAKILLEDSDGSTSSILKHSNRIHSWIRDTDDGKATEEVMLLTTYREGDKK